MLELREKLLESISKNTIKNTLTFESLCLEVFQTQAQHCHPYRQFLDYIDIKPSSIDQIEQIPFLPISLFKGHDILTNPNNLKIAKIFASSGTTGQALSRHQVIDLDLYNTSCKLHFENCFGRLADLHIFALLPSYLERNNSSLVHMVQEFSSQSDLSHGGFYLSQFDQLKQDLTTCRANSTKPILLIGVSFALLDFAEQHHLRDITNIVVMETGGMKGRRKELIREELHHELTTKLGVDQIWSEYGMTELLSQAYTPGGELFYPPPWMQFRYRPIDHPMYHCSEGKGALNIIDLMNLYSCCFIATDDLGKGHAKSVDILGRYDHADIRGCNLLMI